MLRRQTTLAIVCSGRFFNFFQSATLGGIYPLMMKEVVVGYLAIASLACHLATSLLMLLRMPRANGSLARH